MIARQTIFSTLVVAVATLSVAQAPDANPGTPPSAQATPHSPSAPANAGNTASSGGQQQGGGVIPVELAKSLDAKKLKQGDAVEARTSAEMNGPNGLVIPRGSKVIGHITEAHARSKGDQQSSLGVVFDKLEVKGGQELPANATIQAVGAAPNANAFAAANPGAPAPEAGMATQGQANRDTGNMAGMGGTNPRGTNSSTVPGSNPSSAQAGSAPAASDVPANAGTNSSQQLTAQSTGVIGIKDLQLGPDSVLTSSGKDVKLDSGTRLILRVGGVHTQ